MKLFNIPELKQRRKILRIKQTPAETIIWERLKKKKLHNFKFYRQYSIDYYIADFYCPKLKLAIEIDGKDHNSEYCQDYDKVRTELFESLGVSIIRFPNEEVLEDTDSVMKELKQFIQTLPAPFFISSEGRLRILRKKIDCQIID